MAENVTKVLGTDAGISLTGVAGPSTQDGQPVGTVFMGVHVDGATDVVHVRFPGDRHRVRQFATISVLDLLRRKLLGREASADVLR